MLNKYIIFSTFILFQYLWDRLTSECSSIKGELLLFIHHIVGVYIYLGGFLFNSVYHLMFVVIILIHWVTNNNRCELTVITNKYCGNPKEYRFQDLSQKLNLTKIHKDIHYFILFGIIIFDIINIYYKYVC